MIVEFSHVAKKQGANVTLDVWENMNHDFQAYGNSIAESREAYARVRLVADQYCTLQEEARMLPRSAQPRRELDVALSGNNH
jgi:acetyl esterase/lipase